MFAHGTATQASFPVKISSLCVGSEYVNSLTINVFRPSNLLLSLQKSSRNERGVRVIMTYHSQISSLIYICRSTLKALLQVPFTYLHRNSAIAPCSSDQRRSRHTVGMSKSIIIIMRFEAQYGHCLRMPLIASCGRGTIRNYSTDRTCDAYLYSEPASKENVCLFRRYHSCTPVLCNWRKRAKERL